MHLVTSHLLTSLASFMVIFALFAFKHFRRPAVLLLFAIILAAWTTYGAAIRLPWGILVLATQAFNLEFIFQANVAARMAGSAAHAIVTQARLIFSASVVLLAFCGFVLTHRREKSTKMEREIVLTSLGVCSLLGFFAYGGELFMRILLLNLVTLAYFISRASDRKWFFVVIAVFLIVSAPPLNIVAHYGNEVMNYVPVSEMEGLVSPCEIA